MRHSDRRKGIHDNSAELHYICTIIVRCGSWLGQPACESVVKILLGQNLKMVFVMIHFLFHQRRTTQFLYAAILLAASAHALAATPAIVAGNMHSLALKADGSVWAWGRNDNGQLGDGTTIEPPSPVQAFVPGSGVVQIAAGRYHSLALQADGSVWAWGDNPFGQLGDEPGSKWPPQQIQALDSDVVALAAGMGHSVALKKDGSVWTWGNSFHGQLGHSRALKTQPVPALVLAPGSGVVAVAAGVTHNLALKADGSVWAWGRNDGGQLGDGTLVERTAPVQVLAPGSGVVAIIAAFSHSLALKADGSVWVWGDPRKTDIRSAHTEAAKFVPTRVPGFSLFDGK